MISSCIFKLLLYLLCIARSYFFGSNNVMTNVPLYNEIIEHIVNDIKISNLHQMPCFINTMGFVEGNFDSN